MLRPHARFCGNCGQRLWPADGDLLKDPPWVLVRRAAVWFVLWVGLLVLGQLAVNAHVAGSLR